jgi:ABC-2 type transport system permease protein
MRKEFLQIVRDPRTLVITFLIPVVQLFLLGYTATTDVRNVPLALFDQDRGPAARRLIDAYRAADYFRFAYDVGSEAELRAAIENGGARAGIIIPPDFGARVLAGHTAQVAFVLDGSDPNVASTSLAAAELIGQAHSIKLTIERLERRGLEQQFQPAVEVRSRVWYNPDLRSAFFMVPALIGMILQMLTTLLTATAIVRERERGTIEQLIVTPIRSIELVIGKLTPYVILAFIETFEVLIVGHLAFDVPIRGSLWLIILSSGLFLMSSLGIGLFASTIANTQQEAMLTVMMFNLPMIFLSGFFFPIQAMPQVLQFVSAAIPLRYYLVVIRSLLLKGVGFTALQSEIISLAVFGIVIMTLAAMRFRKRLD